MVVWRGAPLKALIWKNFRVRRKSLVATILEIFLPVLAFLLLYVMQVLEPKTVNPNCYLKAKAMPAASEMISLQTFLCAASNTCEDEKNASSESFSSSLISNVAEAIKGSLNLKSMRSGQRKRDIEYEPDLNKWAKDFYIIDSLVETVENENKKWHLLYNKLLRSNIYSETSESENYNIKKLLRMKKNIHMAEVLKSFFRVINVELMPAGELNFLNLFFCGPDMKKIEEQLVSATKEEDQTFTVRSHKDDSDMSSFCNLMVKILEMSEFQSVMKVIKPLLFGKVIYTPDAPVLKRVMKRFGDSLKKMKDVLDSMKLADRMWSELNDWKLHEVIDNYRNEENFLREAVKTRTGRAIVNSFENEPHGDLEEERAKKEINKFQKLLEEVRENYKTYLQETDKKPAVLKILPILECIDFDKVIAMSSEGDALGKARKFLAKQRLWGYIIFTNVPPGAEKLPPSVTYKMRIGSDRTPNTKYKKNSVNFTQARTKPSSNLREITGGTVHLQNMIESELIREYTGRKEVPGIYLQQMPYPCYKIRMIHEMSMKLLSTFIILSWIYFFTRTVKKIVLEKEILFKDVLRIFGVTSAHHWIAFFIDSFFTGAIAALLCSLIFMLIAGDFVVLFLLLLSFVAATIALAFLVSSFLMKASYCTILAGVVYLVLHMFFMLVSGTESPIVQVLLCLISNGALTYGCTWLYNVDSSGLPISTGFLNYQPDGGSVITMLLVIIMLLIDAVIYILLAIYFENILSTRAVRKPWNYCLRGSYWKSCCKGYQPTADVSEPETVQPKKKGDTKNFEAEPEGQVGIEVINISKDFGKAKNKIRVVNNLSINFYENQITSFLGHNGAGKTTTVLMMTGVISPTKGTIRIYGVDLWKNPELALKNIGICFQENILLGDLSAIDHMTLIGKLKCLSTKEINKNLKELLEEFEFKGKATEPVKHLSGGWKRKVCIAMAFMGGSRTIFLDEPTAGIDPFARRSIWDILVRLKNGRTIVLITHHLDEADVLGDRVAIIASGELKCCGSSTFLKSNLDKGYTLTIDTTVRNDKAFSKKNKNAKKQLSPQANDLLGVVKSAMPGAEFEEERGCEFMFVLPTKQSSGDLNRLFETLDKNKKKYDINSYGITAASLEEVFMRVLMKVEAEENTTETVEPSTSRRSYKEDANRSKSIGSYKENVTTENNTQEPETSYQKRKSTLVAEKKSINVSGEVSDHSLEKSVAKSQQISDFEMKKLFIQRQKEKIKTARMFWNHILALWVKRIQHSRRNYIFLLFHIFAPVGLVIFGFISLKLSSPSFPAVHVDVSAYESSILFYTSSDPSNAHLSSYENALLGPYGLGTKCVLSPGTCDLKSIPTGSMVADGKTIDSNKCTCNGDKLECEGNATAEPPEAQMSTGHKLFNLTGLDLNNWLLATEFKYSLKRIGGISFGQSSPLTGVSIGDFLGLFSPKALLNVMEKYLADGVEKIDPKEFTSALMSGFNNSYGQELFKGKDIMDNIIVWFNSADKIASMAMLNGVTNLVLRASLPSGTDPSSYSVKLIVHPFEETAETSQNTKVLESSLGSVLVLLQSLCILMCMFIICLVDERTCGMKQLAFISGVSPFIYWLSYFMWDIVIFSVYIVLLILAALIFEISSLSGSSSLPVFTAVLFSYALTGLLFIYLLSNFFNTSSSAVIFILIWVLLLGSLTLLVSITASMGKSSGWVKILNDIFLLIPEYCLGKCILNLSLGGNMGAILMKASASGYFNWEMSTKYIVRILCNGGVYFVVLMVIEHRTVQPLGIITKLFSSLSVLCQGSKKQEEDSDVAAEKDRVRSGKAKEDGDMFIVKNLTKIYCGQTSPAVNKVCVGVKHGECLGLLGMNGAGKTSFFKMISGNTIPSLGDATIGGLSITYKPLHSRLLIGYCPQTNALDPYLTSGEHLSFFGRINGLDGTKRKKEVDTLIELMNLGKHKSKISKTLSGGNKRKLNAAIALLTEPELILLDEPTAGMDVLARRFLWNRLMEVLQDGRCLILTTHSLEECQALATQVCIMSRGRFVCFGSSQHLKNKFNEGYSVILRLVNVDKIKDVINYMNENLSGSTVIRTHHLYMRIRLHPDIYIGKAVTVLSELKKKQWIEDYSINQTTLENVFLKLIGESNREIASRRGCCNC